jgi:hypothetical protein
VVIVSTNANYPVQIYDPTGWTVYVKLDGEGQDGGRHLRITTSSADRCLMIRYAQNVWVKNCEIDHAVNNDCVKLTSNNQGTDSGGTDDNSGARGCIIENCSIHDGGDYGIKVTGWNTSSNVFSSNLIFLNGAVGPDSYGVNVSGSGYDSDPPRFNVFAGNTLSSNVNSGLQFTVCYSNSVTSNLFCFNGTGVNGGSGMSFGSSAWGNVAGMNLAFCNSKYGLFCSGFAHSNVLVANIVYDNAQGEIRVASTSCWTRIFGNTAVHTNSGYSAVYLSSYCTNTFLTNNILYNEPRDPCVNMSSTSTVCPDYNCYFQPVASGTTSYVLYRGGVFYTLSSFQSGLGLDMNSYNADPGFVNLALRDLGLSPGSPLLGKGVNIGLPFSGSAPDLGAYASGQPAWVSPPTNLRLHAPGS